MIGERMAAGVDGSFEIPVSMKESRFSKLFPDQNQHLRAWAKHLKQKDVKKVLKRLKYTGSAEFFSMYSCLLMDPRILSLDHKTFKSESRETHKGTQEVYEAPGVWLRGPPSHSAPSCDEGSLVLRLRLATRCWSVPNFDSRTLHF